MIAYEDYCIGCPKEMGCLGAACPMKNVPVTYCDTCGADAEYEVEGEHYCNQCIRNRLIEEFNSLTTEEMLDGFEYVWESTINE